MAAEPTQEQQDSKLQAIFQPESDYLDLFRNLYKYADKMKIDGVDPADTMRHFEMVRDGNAVIQTILDGASHEDVEAALSVTNFGTESGPDVDRLCEMFRWGLGVWLKVGEQYGRPPTIDALSVDALVLELRGRIEKSLAEA